MYYNGVTPGMNPNTLKDVEGAYLVTGYPGPAFPPVSTPPNGTTQVAVLSGNDTSFVPAQFNDTFRVGDRLMLAVYDSTVMEIPDFAISPPVEIALPATTVTPYDGPTTTISRNDDFHSTVTLSLRGDAGAAAVGHPEYDILPDPSVTPPATGDMTEPIWSPNVFEPAKNGTTVRLNDMQSNAIPPGIYTVWIEGESGNPYYQRRQVPVPVRVQTDGNNDGDYNDAVDVKVTRDFSLRQLGPRRVDRDPGRHDHPPAAGLDRQRHDQLGQRARPPRRTSASAGTPTRSRPAASSRRRSAWGRSGSARPRSRRRPGPGRR